MVQTYVHIYWQVFPFDLETCNFLAKNLSTWQLHELHTVLVNIKKLLISKRRIGILKKLPKQGEDSESL